LHFYHYHYFAPLSSFYEVYHQSALKTTCATIKAKAKCLRFYRWGVERVNFQLSIKSKQRYTFESTTLLLFSSSSAQLPQTLKYTASPGFRHSMMAALTLQSQNMGVTLPELIHFALSLTIMSRSTAKQALDILTL